MGSLEPDIQVITYNHKHMIVKAVDITVTETDLNTLVNILDHAVRQSQDPFEAVTATRTLRDKLLAGLKTIEESKAADSKQPELAVCDGTGPT